MSIRRYRWHRCERRHLSGRKFAECAFPPEYAQRGVGQWVVVALCAVPSVSLYRSKTAAIAELKRVDDENCAPGCTWQHHLAYLDLHDAQTDRTHASPGEVA